MSGERGRSTENLFSFVAVGFKGADLVRARTAFNLMGTFQVISPEKVNITPLGQKARALLALVATADHHERSRTWLSDKLWSNSDARHANSSLRQALRQIRKSFGVNADDIIHIDKHSVRLISENIVVDVERIAVGEIAIDDKAWPDFLEGLDIQDEEFEEWLSVQRAYYAELLATRRRSEVAALSNGGDVESVRNHRAKPAMPVVAVAPFRERGNLDLEGYFIDGLTQEVIEQLSRIRWLSVIARGSSFAASEPGPTLLEFARELAADYVVTGEIGKGPGGLRLTVELMKYPASSLVWSTSFEFATPGAVPDLAGMVFDIAGNIDSMLANAEQDAARTESSTGNEVRDLIWRGRWHLNQLSKNDSDIAERCFRAVLERDPNNSEAHVQLAWSHLWRAWIQRGTREEIHAGRRLGQQAIKLDGSDGRGYWIVGTAEAWLLNHNEAIAYVDEAVRLSPSLAIAHAQQGTNHLLIGQPDKALPSIETALKLSPKDKQVFFVHGEKAMACWMIGDHERALASARQAIMLRPSYWYAHLVRYLAYRSLGDARNMNIARKQLLELRHGLSAADIRWLPFKDRDLIEFFVRSLEFAWPDH
ncbi:MAG: hypothetical protein R3D32_01280 [Nitratireductor sp.]